MVKAIIDISKRANRVLNIVKAKYGLRNKSEAIERMSREYEEHILEPSLRPVVRSQKERRKTTVPKFPLKRIKR